MRLDKYLKVSRLIKRRTIAKELADNNRILVNGRIAKPSLNLEVDDIIEISFRNKVSRYQVVKLVDQVKKAESTIMYKMLE